MPEWLHVEKSPQRQFGTPDPTPDFPVRPWKILRGPAPAHFHEADPVPFFGEPMRRNAAAKPGADYDEVEVHGVHPMILCGSFGADLQKSSAGIILSMSMHKLPPVEEAKQLFEAAKDWGLWRWLLEKRHVRQTADAAWAAFDEYEDKVKTGWGEDIRKAWREAETEAAAAADGRAKRAYEKAKAEAKGIDPDVKAKVRLLHEADTEAYKARMDA